MCYTYSLPLEIRANQGPIMTSSIAELVHYTVSLESIEVYDPMTEYFLD